MKLSTMRLTALGLTWVLLAGASPLTWAADWAAVGLMLLSIAAVLWPRRA